MQYRDTFFAMNTEIETILDSPSPLPWVSLSIKLLFDQQEERFSRFRPSSLVSRLNRGEVVDDGWLASACSLALEAHAFTGGLFNPMVLPALAEAGYGVSFEQVGGGAPRAQGVPAPADCLRITGDRVELLRGRLDLGGIVKGWSADLAVEAAAADCPNVFVNAGGDIRCSGADEGQPGWGISIEEPRDGRVVWEGRIAGAVATSTSMKRRWTTDSGAQAHHLIDPRTGLPAESPYIQVTAWAAETWRAECWAKAVLIGGEPALHLARSAGITLLTVDGAGDARMSDSPGT